MLLLDRVDVELLELEERVDVLELDRVEVLDDEDSVLVLEDDSVLVDELDSVLVDDDDDELERVLVELLDNVEVLELDRVLVLLLDRLLRELMLVEEELLLFSSQKSINARPLPLLYSSDLSADVRTRFQNPTSSIWPSK